MRILLPTILFVFLSAGVFSQRYFPIKVHKKWGLMNSEGQIALPPVYDAIGEFKRFGYAAMQRNGGVGLLNNMGEEVVPPEFEDLKVLDSTLISVMKKGAWMVINLQGKVVLKPGYEKVKALDKRYLSFSKNKLWGIVDVEGQLIAEPRYEEVTWMKNHYFQTKSAGSYGLLREDGFTLLEPLADEIVMYNKQLFFFKKQNKWGAVNQNGEVVLTPNFDHFSKLANNFIKLRSERKVFLFSLFYMRLITQGEYDAYYPFSKDFVICKKNRLLGLLDNCGTPILSARFNEIQGYGEGFFRANLSGKWGVVNAGGKVAIPFEFDYIGPLKSGYCVVINDRKMGVANFKGEVIVAPAFDRILLEKDRAKAFKKEKLTLFHFDPEGQLEDESRFDKLLTVKVGQPKAPSSIPWKFSQDDDQYLLENFEWFYSPKEDKWGLRRLDDGSIQIKPTFDQVRVIPNLGLTLVGIETMEEHDFDRTSYRFEMAYGLVNNKVGLLVKAVNLVDIRLNDFDKGYPVARCIFLNGRHGLINRIGKVILKDFAFIGDFHDGLARMSVKGNLSGSISQKWKGLGELNDYLNAHLAPVFRIDFTLFDRQFDREAVVTCEDCVWGYLDTLGETIVAPQYSFAKDFVNEVGIVACGEKWGMLSKKGRELIPCHYDEVGFLENTNNQIIRIYQKNEKCGLIDTLGQLTVSLKYDEIGSFSEGRLAVKRNGRWGFVNPNGLEVIPCRFRAVKNFSAGWAAVKSGNKWGYIDKQGNVELDFQFSRAGNFKNGLAFAKKDSERYGYITQKGKWFIPPIYTEAHDFDKGLARVRVLSGDYNRMGLIDLSGEYRVRPKFIQISEFNEHGLAVVSFGNGSVKHTLINREGIFTSPLRFREIGPFREGLARVRTKVGYGFINTLGQLVFPGPYSKAGDFSDGRAFVQKDGQCGYIDKRGREVVDLKFSRCMDFREGKAVVFKGNKKAGLIDSTGNFLIEPGINRMLLFSEGRGLVRDERYRFYYVTEQANLYEGFYQKAGAFKNGVAVVQIEGRWGIINQKGIEIIPPKYDKIEQFKNGFAKVRIKGFNGLSNLQGKLLVEPDYEYISYAGEGLFRAEQGDKIGYFDMDGNWIWGLSE